MEETKLMNDQIHDKLGLNPDDKEVVVLYDGEKDKVIVFARFYSNWFVIHDKLSLVFVSFVRQFKCVFDDLIAGRILGRETSYRNGKATSSLVQQEFTTENHTATGQNDRSQTNKFGLNTLVIHHQR